MTVPKSLSSNSVRGSGSDAALMHGLTWAEAPGHTTIRGPIMSCSKCFFCLFNTGSEKLLRGSTTPLNPRGPNGRLMQACLGGALIVLLLLLLSLGKFQLSSGWCRTEYPSNIKPKSNFTAVRVRSYCRYQVGYVN